MKKVETVTDITKAVVGTLKKEPENQFGIVEAKDVGRNSGW